MVEILNISIEFLIISVKILNMSVEITNILLEICVYKIDKNQKITLKILFDITKNVYKHIKNTLEYRAQVCQKIWHSHKNIMHNIDNKKSKNGGWWGRGKRILHSLIRRFPYQFFYRNVHQNCVKGSKPNTSPPALRNAVLSTEMCQQNCASCIFLSKTPACLNLKVKIRHFFDFLAHFCR